VGRAPEVGKHELSFALVVTFTQYIKQFFRAGEPPRQRYTILQSAMSGASASSSWLDEKEIDPEPIAEKGRRAGRTGRRGAGARERDFEYKPDVPVLRDVSLTVKRGEKSRSSARRGPARRP